jgi:hypothetical protein
VFTLPPASHGDHLERCDASSIRLHVHNFEVISQRPFGCRANRLSSSTEDPPNLEVTAGCARPGHDLEVFRRA